MPHQQFSSCVTTCYECAQACNHCAASCLQEQEVKAMAKCIALDIDCDGNLRTCRFCDGTSQRNVEASLFCLCSGMPNVRRRMCQTSDAALSRLRTSLHAMCR